jgi:hypothetical protein
MLDAQRNDGWGVGRNAGVSDQAKRTIGMRSAHQIVGVRHLDRGRKRHQQHAHNSEDEASKSVEPSWRMRLKQSDDPEGDLARAQIRNTRKSKYILD